MSPEDVVIGHLLKLLMLTIFSTYKMFRSGITKTNRGTSTSNVETEPKHPYVKVSKQYTSVYLDGSIFVLRKDQKIKEM